MRPASDISVFISRDPCALYALLRHVEVPGGGGWVCRQIALDGSQGVNVFDASLLVGISRVHNDHEDVCWALKNGLGNASVSRDEIVANWI